MKWEVWQRTENDFYLETIKNINNTTKRRSDLQKVTSYLLHMIHVDFSQSVWSRSAMQNAECFWETAKVRWDVSRNCYQNSPNTDWKKIEKEQRTKKQVR